MYHNYSQCLNNTHKWKTNTGRLDLPCIVCQGYPEFRQRALCTTCRIESCITCANTAYSAKLTLPQLTAERTDNLKLQRVEQQISLANTEIEVLKDSIDIQIGTLQQDVNEIKSLLRQFTSSFNQAKDKAKIKIDESVKIDESQSFQKIDESQSSLDTGPSTHTAIQNIRTDYEQVETALANIACKDPEDITSFQVPVKFFYGNTSITLDAFIDTGCTSSLIDEKLIHKKQYITHTDTSTIAQQMDGHYYRYNKQLENCKIQFFNTCNKYSHSYPLPTVWVRDLTPLNIQLFLGLKFFIHDNGGILLTKDHLLLFRQLTTVPHLLTSELHTERGELSTPCSKDSAGRCTCPKVVHSAKSKTCSSYSCIQINTVVQFNTV